MEIVIKEDAIHNIYIHDNKIIIRKKIITEEQQELITKYQEVYKIDFSMSHMLSLISIILYTFCTNRHGAPRYYVISDGNALSTRLMEENSLKASVILYLYNKEISDKLDYKNPAHTNTEEDTELMLPWYNLVSHGIYCYTDREKSDFETESQIYIDAIINNLSTDELWNTYIIDPFNTLYERYSNQTISAYDRLD